jgi:DnaJ-class molecular chaperone
MESLDETFAPGEILRSSTKLQQVKEDIECDVDVPRGAYDNYFIKHENEGNYIPKDERTSKASRTNVLVVIKEIVPEDTNIRRGMFIKEINRINRADLLFTVNITFGESLAGIKKEIAYLGDEKVGIEINTVIQNGDIHVIKNMGMCLVPEELEKVKLDKTHSGRGDLFMVFKVERPILTNQQQKRLWQIVTDTAYPEYDDVDHIHESLEFEKYIKEQMILIKNRKHIKSKGSDKDSDDQKDSDDRTNDSCSDDDKIDIDRTREEDSETPSDSDEDPDENFEDLLDDDISKDSDSSKRHSAKSSKKR